MNNKFYAILWMMVGLWSVISPPHRRVYDVLGGFFIGLALMVIFVPENKKKSRRISKPLRKESEK